MIKFWNAKVFVKIYFVKALHLSCSLSVILEVKNLFLTYMYNNKERSWEMKGSCTSHEGSLGEL